MKIILVNNYSRVRIVVLNHSNFLIQTKVVRIISKFIKKHLCNRIKMNKKDKEVHLLKIIKVSIKAHKIKKNHLN